MLQDYAAQSGLQEDEAPSKFKSKGDTAADLLYSLPIEPDRPMSAIDLDRSFLILDVRPQEEWEKCHIKHARSYPSSMLSRSVNEFTTEIIAFVILFQH
jgi:hypothetical protein